MKLIRLAVLSVVTVSTIAATPIPKISSQISSRAAEICSTVKLTSYMDVDCEGSVLNPAVSVPTNGDCTLISSKTAPSKIYAVIDVYRGLGELYYFADDKCKTSTGYGEGIIFGEKEEMVLDEDTKPYCLSDPDTSFSMQFEPCA
ncbi:hypothetical protein SARC_06398 [Sphaeroforma arctica JP610]|uniref:Uncharacterized protein n=1 Tax=Sphaeroforma arctica JP610 TaxID=667725 RepID=A0A0L0FWR5_9EUKA|nr:hypothetical protein SARC_06398 [Sphaeroforma arctica JP610]KNC81267.1 hypothetical protein SARC_06398 [Sphaeroforma arctica JP610]|eukprot:XP_014155169.1 hypothetical protein SARC_06398 [Sphaeroforma arctica JP610]